jgi:hypothetical protein
MAAGDTNVGFTPRSGPSREVGLEIRGGSVTQTPRYLPRYVILLLRFAECRIVRSVQARSRLALNEQRIRLI